MAARNPVIALDGPGVRDVITAENGRLLSADATAEEFAAALSDVTRDRPALKRLGESARRSVRDYDIAACCQRLESLYQELVAGFSREAQADFSPWDKMLLRLQIEWNLLVEKAAAVKAAVAADGPPPSLDSPSSTVNAVNRVQ